VLMDVIIVLALLEMSFVQIIHVIKQLLAIMQEAYTMKEIHSPVLMDVIILVLALLEMSLVQIIHVKQ